MCETLRDTARGPQQQEGSRCPHGPDGEAGRKARGPGHGLPRSTIPRTNTENKHFSSLSFSLVKPRGQDLTEEILPGPVCPSAQSPEAPSCPGEVTQWPERHGQGKAQGRQPPRTGTREQTTAPVLRRTQRHSDGCKARVWGPGHSPAPEAFPQSQDVLRRGLRPTRGTVPNYAMPPCYVHSDPGRPLQGHWLCTSP